MTKDIGLKVKSISQSCIFYGSGLRNGDSIFSVNGELVEDELDFRFFSAESQLEITFFRYGIRRTISVLRPEGSYIEMDFYEKPINRCINRCIFCFIDQMPPGLRRGLYIKDEDIKHSFINGNYVTLSNMKFQDLEKVAKLGISPLYISVHATDTDIRNIMLGNKKAPSIMTQLQFLSSKGMYMHTQIVICPGFNDGIVLKRTVKDLFGLGNALRSIAVVPVGVTKFRKIPLRTVDAQNAQIICKYLEITSDSFAQKDGFRRLFCADELFLRAGFPLPSLKYYEDYPQIENGVGLIRMLLEEWKKCKKQITSGMRSGMGKKSILILSSASAFSYVKNISKEAVSLFPELSVDVLPVSNTFFGESVTVAGLLTAKDVLPLLRNAKKSYDCAYLPSVMFNYDGFSLDGYSLNRMCKISGMDVKAVESICDVFTVIND